MLRELRRLFFDRGEQRGPVRGECACSVALEMLGEGIGVDTGVGGRSDGPFGGCVVGFQPLVEALAVGEGEQCLLRDGVDRVRGGEPTEIVGVKEVWVLGRGGCPQNRCGRAPAWASACQRWPASSYRWEA